MKNQKTQTKPTEAFDYARTNEASNDPHVLPKLWARAVVGKQQHQRPQITPEQIIQQQQQSIQM